MVRTLSGNPRFEGYVFFCFLFMSTPENRSKIAFTMFASVNQCNNVVAVPWLTSANESTAMMAITPMALKNAKTHALRYSFINMLADPFFN